MWFFPLLAFVFAGAAVAGICAAISESSRADEESRKRQAEAEEFARERKRMSDALAANEADIAKLKKEVQQRWLWSARLSARIKGLEAENAELKRQIREPWRVAV